MSRSLLPVLSRGKPGTGAKRSGHPVEGDGRDVDAWYASIYPIVGGFVSRIRWLFASGTIRISLLVRVYDDLHAGRG